MTAAAPSPDIEIGVNRFVSTLAGALRSFYIYQQDNKAFNDIMKNLAHRFQDSISSLPAIELEITNRSILFGGKHMGYKETSAYLADHLYRLGFKKITFRSSLVERHL